MWQVNGSTAEEQSDSFWLCWRSTGMGRDDNRKGISLSRPQTINLYNGVGQLADYRRSRRYSCLVWAVLFNWILSYTTLGPPDGFRRRPIRFKKLIGYDASWLSERTRAAQLIVWAVLADGIGNRKPFAGFTGCATPRIPTPSAA